MAGMLVVTRYSVPESESGSFLAAARAALAVLAAQRGYRSGRIGRATDDPALWALVMEWEGVGAYRRALSSYDVRVAAVPLLSRAYDEPSAFEVLADEAGPAEGTRRAADADLVGVGEASAPAVPVVPDAGPPGEGAARRGSPGGDPGGR